MYEVNSWSLHSLRAACAQPLGHVQLCGRMDCSLPGSPLHGFFSRQEFWSGLLYPTPGDRYHPGIELHLPRGQADSLPSPSVGSLPLTFSDNAVSMVGIGW